MKPHLVVLSGAGISAESGLKTFRDADGLWEGYDVMTVASPEGFARDPQLVLDFYNQRRRQLKVVAPNFAHRALVALENTHHVTIVTQNVDDLHERAGSKHVLHLHGELNKARSTKDKEYVVDWCDDITLQDVDPNGYQLRPHIVWFGEMVPLLTDAIALCRKADILLIVGTSMQVYPAASLVEYVADYVPIYYIDPRPVEGNFRRKVQHIQTIASKGMELFTAQLHNQ